MSSRREFITLLGGAAALASRGAGAAGGDAGDWVSECKVTGRYDEVTSCVSEWPTRDRLCRRPQCDDRLPCGGRSIRSPPWARRRTDSSQSSCHRFARHGPNTYSEGSDYHDSNCFLNWRRPGAIWLGCQPEPAGRQSNGPGRSYNTLVPKQLEMLHELVPSATLVAFLVNPKNPISENDTKDLQAAASVTRQKILALNASIESDINDAFAALTHQGANALLVQTDPLFNGLHHQIAGLAARYRVPAVLSLREFVEAGGLMSYGTDLLDAYRQLGLYAGKILKGAKPSDLPVEQSVKSNCLSISEPPRLSD